MDIAFFLITLAITLAIGVPVAFAVAVGALGLLVLFSDGLPPEAVLVLMATRIYTGSDSFPLLAMPLFFLAGGLMEAAGISDRLVRLGIALVGWMRGGLAMVGVVASMFMSTVSGSASADAAAVGSVIIPALKKRGYSAEFAAALVASAGSLGPIIPPSILLVIYGSLTNTSISQLFLAGVVPGIVVGVGLIAVCFVLAMIRGYPKEDRMPIRAIARVLFEALIPLTAPLIVLGGIFAGIFTATESAMVAALYSLLVGVFVYRTLNWRKVLALCYDTALASSRVMFIIGVAAFVSWVMAREQIPQRIGEQLLTVSDSPTVMLLVINVLVLIFGMFLEASAILVILLPTLMPVVLHFGIDPVFFGVILIINLAIGTVTPPLGICLFVTSSIAEVPLERCIREVLPFLCVMIGTLALLTYMPALVLWLPRLLIP
jgi:C4-dicarboxylate transporter DctM subunit